MTLLEVATRANAVLDEVERAVVGKRDELSLVVMGMLADGHVLLEDFPRSGEDTGRPFARPGDEHRLLADAVHPT